MDFWRGHNFDDLPKFKGANCESLALSFCLFSLRLYQSGVDPCPYLKLLLDSLVDVGPVGTKRVDLVDVIALKNRTIEVLKENCPEIFQRFYDLYLG